MKQPALREKSREVFLALWIPELAAVNENPAADSRTS